jgi:hypothetical protein
VCTRGLVSVGDEPPAQTWIRQQARERVGDRRRRRLVDEEAVHVVGDETRNTGDSRRDDRHAGRHRLEQHARDSLAG